METYGIPMDQFLHWIPALFPNLEQLIIKCDYEENKLQEQFQKLCLNGQTFPRLTNFKFFSF